MAIAIMVMIEVRSLFAGEPAVPELRAEIEAFLPYSLQSSGYST
jgi:hypothetical protein